METRKVQVTGKSTFVVSLPKNWVNRVRIHSGDSVAMIPLTDGTLLVNPNLTRKGSESVKKVISLDVDDLEQVFRRFVGAYLAGYSTIEFKSRQAIEKEVRQTIRQFSKSLIGPEIIDEGQNTIIMRNLLDASTFSLAKGIRRMHVIARDMHQEAIEALRTGKVEVVMEVKSRDDEVDKLYWMIAKQYNLALRDFSLAEKMQIRPQEALGYLLVARSLERIADHAARIAAYSPELLSEVTLVDELVQLSKAIIAILDEAVNAFYKVRFDLSHDTVNKSAKLRKELQEMKHNLLTLHKEPSSIIPLAYVIESLERTLAYATDIAEIGINHEYLVDYGADLASMVAAGGESQMDEYTKPKNQIDNMDAKSTLPNG